MYVGSERDIVSQMVTVEPQITEGRVAHTGSAFLPLAVTAPTDVCLNWALIHEEITSPLKSPPTPPLTPMLLKYPSLLCKKRTLSPTRYISDIKTPLLLDFFLYLPNIRYQSETVTHASVRLQLANPQHNPAITRLCV